MSITDFLTIVAFVATVISVRFLLPMGVCWLINAVSHHYYHPAA